jgi:uncharacterized membrane protein
MHRKSRFGPRGPRNCEAVVSDKEAKEGERSRLGAFPARLRQPPVDGIEQIREIIRETEKRIKRLGERSQDIKQQWRNFDHKSIQTERTPQQFRR